MSVVKELSYLELKLAFQFTASKKGVLMRDRRSTGSTNHKIYYNSSTKQRSI